MLIIFEGPDKTGKTTLAMRLSKDLDIPYIKLNNINIKENDKILNGISISTHSQLETVVQLHENGLLKDAILDRFHISELVYSKLYDRKYDNQYIKNIDERLNQFNDVILVKTYCYPAALKKRWSNEKLLNLDSLNRVVKYYEQANSSLPTIKIDTSEDEDVSFLNLSVELYVHGIYKNHPRPRRENHVDTMMKIAHTIAKRSPDLSRQVGAVLTENGFVIGMGYNGPPSGLKHDEINIRAAKGYKSGEALEMSRAVHAEQNCLMQAGLRFNRKSNDLVMFVTDQPCIHCMRMIIQAGIKKIYYTNPYPHKLSVEMAEEAGLELIQWKK